MPPVTSITVVYDSDCGLCTHTKEWIKQQTPLVELCFLASDSRSFPQANLP